MEKPHHFLLHAVLILVATQFNFGFITPENIPLKAAYHLQTSALLLNALKKRLLTCITAIQIFVTWYL